MKTTAAFVLSRTADLVSRFRSKPRAAAVPFVRARIVAKRHSPEVRPSTEMLVRRLAQPVMQRRNTPAF